MDYEDYGHGHMKVYMDYELVLGDNKPTNLYFDSDGVVYSLAVEFDMDDSWCDLLHHISDEVVPVSQAVWIVLMTWKGIHHQQLTLNG